MVMQSILDTPLNKNGQNTAADVTSLVSVSDKWAIKSTGSKSVQHKLKREDNNTDRATATDQDETVLDDTLSIKPEKQQ